MTRQNYNTDITVVHTDTGKISGRIRGDTFYRNIRSNHILNKPPALAMDASIAAKLQARAVGWLEFRNTDTGETFRASFAHFMAKAFEIDRGYGRQLALPLAGWTRRTRGGGRQLTMFEGRR